MSELLELVDSLEVRIQKTIIKLREKEQHNSRLVAELAIKEDAINEQAKILNNWEEKYSVLKLTSSMLGSDEYKRETKLKINTLIREIDYCIEQLSK